MVKISSTSSDTTRPPSVFHPLSKDCRRNFTFVSGDREAKFHAELTGRSILYGWTVAGGNDHWFRKLISGFVSVNAVPTAA